MQSKQQIVWKFRLYNVINSELYNWLSIGMRVGAKCNRTVQIHNLYKEDPILKNHSSLTEAQKNCKPLC